MTGECQMSSQAQEINTLNVEKEYRIIMSQKNSAPFIDMRNLR